MIPGLSLLMPALNIAKVVPVWAWALAGALAWGAYQRHEVKVAHGKLLVAAAEKADLAASALQESNRQLMEQKGIAEDGQKKLQRAQELGTAIARDVGGLQRDLEALRAAAAASTATVTEQREAVDRLSRVSGECAARYSEVASAAQSAALRGLSCQRHYESLTPGSTGK